MPSRASRPLPPAPTPPCCRLARAHLLRGLLAQQRQQLPQDVLIGCRWSATAMPTRSGAAAQRGDVVAQHGQPVCRADPLCIVRHGRRQAPERTLTHPPLNRQVPSFCPQATTQRTTLWLTHLDLGDGGSQPGLALQQACAVGLQVWHTHRGQNIPPPFRLDGVPQPRPLVDSSIVEG